jgi:excinuclease ABC subunit B
LIQTIGRAARNVSGEVHMYADKITPSMERAIDETSRRRAKQEAYNTERGIEPTALRKKIADILDSLAREDEDTEQLIGGSGRSQSRGKAPVPGFGSKKAGRHAHDLAGEHPREEVEGLIASMTEQMHQAAADLQFELAARLRDEIKELKRELRDLKEAGIG